MSLESMSAVASTSTLVSQLYPTRNGLVSVFIQLQLNELVIISIIIIMLLFYNCRLTEAQNRMSIEHTHNTPKSKVGCDRNRALRPLEAT